MNIFRNNQTNGMNFGIQNQQPLNLSNTDFSLNNGLSQFGFGQNMLGNIGVPQASNLNLSNVNFDPSQSLNNFGFQTTQPTIDPNNTLGFNNNSNLFADGSNLAPTDTGMTTGDMFNFGSNLLQTGIGAYFAKKQLDQGQQALDLTQKKYSDYLADKEKLDTVSTNRANNAFNDSITFGGKG